MVKIKETALGEGIPKICVPVMGANQEEVLENAQELQHDLIDMVEWRVDYWENLQDTEKIIETASLLQSMFTKKPLLFTFRTAKEGGEKEILWEDYRQLLETMAASHSVDLIDVEAFRGYDAVSEEKKQWQADDACNAGVQAFIQTLQKDVAVIGSYHDFSKTPSQEEIANRLAFISEIGADIPKIAVMPKKESDVFTLMQATLQAKEAIGDKPVITMSMAFMGSISRILGASFGSAVTFGCVGVPSAPGQIEASKLSTLLQQMDEMRQGR